VATVVITGCSSGFGLATALAFARRGDRVWATMRDPARGEALLSAADAESLTLEVLQLDVTDASSVSAAVGRIVEEAGAVEVLVNNAGLGHLGTVEMTPDPLVRTMFETNLFGALAMIRAVLPGMRERRSGVIVNVSSVAGRLPGTPGNWAYSASKHALGSLSDSLAEEVRAFGIRVVCLEPGFFRTGVTRAEGAPSAASPYRDLEERVTAYFRAGVEGGGDPAAVAEVIVKAATDPASPLHIVVGSEAQRSVEAMAAMSEAKGAEVRRAAMGLD
jgi:NAD(P)-dependent dehydrogenase (short-subunit alcohol dehydrogenase family)